MEPDTAPHAAAHDASLQRTHSEHTLNTNLNDDSATNATATGSPAASRSRPNRNAVRHSTAYVRNYRLSRYRNALRGALPFRLNQINDNVELPLDSIGCFTTCTFAWIRGYRVVDPPVQYRWRWWPFRRAAARSTQQTPADASPAAVSNSTASSPPLSTSAASTTTQPTPSPERSPPLVPLLPASDRCEVNAKRLLGLYKYEEQSRGRIGASMARVTWQFCRTRVLVAGALHTLAHLMAVLMLAVFLQMTMQLIESSWLMGVPAQFQGKRVLLHRYMGTHTSTVVYLVGLVGSLMAQNYLRGAAHALGLRTAIRLRTACLGAVCSKTLKASVRHPIAAHQIAALAADESQWLGEMVIKGPLLVANLLGIGFCALAAGISLGGPGIWPMFGVIGILPVGALCALLSAIFYRRSVSFLAKKLSIVEEYYRSYNPDECLNVHESYTKRFAGALHTQYLNLCKAELLRPGVTAHLITLAVILGGTFLVWCDMQFPTETIAMTALTFMYVLLVPGWVAEWLDAVQAIAHGRGVLAKVKQALTLAPPELPKMRPTRDLKVSMADAIFRWNGAGGEEVERSATRIDMSAVSANGHSGGGHQHEHSQRPFELRIDSLTIPKNALVGITGPAGSGKTSLVHALLGHLQLRAGEFYQRDKGSLYPEVPYLLEGSSIRDNIVFHDDWHEQRYRDALMLAELHFNADNDERTTVDQVHDLLQLQRIGMARALYSDRDFVVLEEPLSAVDVEADLSALFEMCTDRLREQGKTVVVVSQNESILRHCQRIYVLSHGTSTGYVEYEDAAGQPAYRNCVEEYAERKRDARQSVHLSNLRNAHGAHNISTEDLVAVEEQPQPKEPGTLSMCEILTLAALCVLDATYSAVFPIGVVVYMSSQQLENEQPMPWAVFNILIFVPVFLLTGWLTRTWLNRIGRQRNKRVQRDLFAKLLGTALVDQRDAHLGQLQHTMIDNHLGQFQNCAQIMHGSWVVLMCVLLCFFNKSVVFLAVMLPLLDVAYRVRRYRRTVSRYAMLEAETRLKLLHLLGNQLKGRVVIQSFDAVQRLRATLYRTVEENSAAELVLRATIAYNQHTLVFWQAITLAVSLVLLNAYPYQRATEFGFEVYVYLLAVAHLSQIMVCRFQNFATDQQLSAAHWLLQTNNVNSADISTLKYEI